MCKSRRPCVRAVLASAIGLVLGNAILLSSANAAPVPVVVWNGSVDQNLSNSSNYSATPDSTDEVRFPTITPGVSAPPYSITTSGDLSARFLDWDIDTTHGGATSYNLGGNSITIATNGNIDSDLSTVNQEISVTTLTLSGAAVLFGSSSSSNTSQPLLTISSTNFTMGTGAIQALFGDITISNQFTKGKGSIVLSAGRTLTLTGGFSSTSGDQAMTGLGTMIVAGGVSGWTGNLTLGTTSNPTAGNIEVRSANSLGAVGTAAGGGSGGYTDLLSKTGGLVLNNAGGMTIGETVFARGRSDATASQIVNKAGNNTFSGILETEKNGLGTNVVLESQAGKLTFSPASQIIQDNTGLAAAYTLNLIGAGDGEIQSTLVQDASTTTWGVTKDGPGTWTISGTQNYSGPTAVNGGKLKMNASQTLGGNYTIAALATLAGTGSTTSTITGGTGTVAPGDVGTIGALTVSNPLAAAVSVGKLAIDFNSTTATTDLLNDLGPIDFTNTTLTFTDLAFVTPTTPLIFANYLSETGTPTYTAPQGYSVVFGLNSASLVPTVPEPASIGLIAIGAIGLIRRRRH